MREIKFRGKRVNNGVWVCGDLERSRYTDTTRIHTYDVYGAYDTQYEVNPCTVGQYTGLKDNNGKAIYEGDIVRYKEANDEIAIKQVHFIAGAFSPLTEIIWMGDAECEVIGNVFDNPEQN